MGEDNKPRVSAYVGETLREIVRFIDREDIKKDSVVTIQKENNQFWLVYYK